jgi:hypothetical protein
MTITKTLEQQVFTIMNMFRSRRVQWLADQLDSNKEVPNDLNEVPEELSREAEAHEIAGLFYRVLETQEILDMLKIIEEKTL